MCCLFAVGVITIVTWEGMQVVGTLFVSVQVMRHAGVSQAWVFSTAPSIASGTIEARACTHEFLDACTEKS